ncbi:MAG: nucleotidyltransferase domain-containing protein [Cytophagales bacterium]|nr:nucleotidyltransferase domain-containing protein [Cytophagales bacterium]
MISPKYIKTITEKIIEVIQPEKIILFGSYAYGKSKEGSDLDLLVVVKDSNEPRFKRARRIRKHLWGLISTPKDILVYTEKEVKEWSNVPQAFITSIVSKGKLLYERNVIP